MEVNHDQGGGSSRVRPDHCTAVGLTPTITPNVGNSNAKFLLVGNCVRAVPFYSLSGIKLMLSPGPKSKQVCHYQDAVCEVILQGKNGEGG